MTILCDEHVPHQIVEGLRRRGIEVFTAQEKGLTSVDDEALLEFAREYKYVLYTRDADHLRLHQRGIQHSGILYHHPTAYSIGESIRRIIIVSDRYTTKQMKNRVIFI